MKSRYWAETSDAGRFESLDDAGLVKRWAQARADESGRAVPVLWTRGELFKDEVETQIYAMCYPTHRSVDTLLARLRELPGVSEPGAHPASVLGQLQALIREYEREGKRSK